MTKARPLPADPNDAMQEMMNTIDSLRGVYVRENEALDAADARKFIELQEEKLDAARKYQSDVEDLLARKDQIRTANPILKKRLAEMEKEFSDLSGRNVESLKRMQRCTQRLGATIMTAAKDAAKKRRAVSYGESGALKSDERKTVSIGISETA